MFQSHPWGMAQDRKFGRKGFIVVPHTLGFPIFRDVHNANATGLTCDHMGVSQILDRCHHILFLSFMCGDHHRHGRMGRLGFMLQCTGNTDLMVFLSTVLVSCQLGLKKKYFD